MYLAGDKVKYVGSKFRSELALKRGEVVATVRNQPSAVVVDFGDDTYICNVNNLKRFVPSPMEEKEVEIRKRRADPEVE